MLNQSLGPVVDSLKEMIQHCKNIQILLETDRNHFSNNDLKSLEESNVKKAELINQLNQLVTQVDTHEIKSKTDIDSIINQLKTEVNQCYKLLAVNNNIVFTNMQQLKEIWDKLAVQQRTAESIYDHNGCTVK